MRNPFRWIFGPRRTSEHPEAFGPGGTSEDSGSGSTSDRQRRQSSSRFHPKGAAARTLEAIEALTQQLERIEEKLDGQAQRDRERAQRLCEALERFEEHLLTRIEALCGDLRVTRKEFGDRFQTLEEGHAWMQKRTNELIGRTDLLRTQLASLEKVSEEQLGAHGELLQTLSESTVKELGRAQSSLAQLRTDSQAQTAQSAESLKALREVNESNLRHAGEALEVLRTENERQLRELRASHQWHLKSVDEDRQRDEAASRGERQRLGERMLEVADELQRDSQLPVPLPKESRADHPDLPGWTRPVARVRALLRQREISEEFETRARDLEEQLRAQTSHCAHQGQMLRDVWQEIERREAQADEDTIDMSAFEFDDEKFAKRLAERSGRLRATTNSR
ncbi:MAG: hypothetical protein AAF517_17990 [Planctomycetota bacterium]